MDGSRFDDLTKVLAAGTSRRRMLNGLLGGAAAGALSLVGLRRAGASHGRPAGATCIRNEQCASGICDPQTRRCACTPTISCPAGQTCGTAEDGCGGTLECGTCTGTGERCVSGQCVCTPDNAAACTGLECGIATNNCDQTVSCGTCTVAGESCVNGQCVCTATGQPPCGTGAAAVCCAEGEACVAGACQASAAGTCTEGTNYCYVGETPNTLCGPANDCTCLTTTASVPFCAANLYCHTCKADAECEAVFGLGSACIDFTGEFCVACADTGGTACAGPCAFADEP